MNDPAVPLSMILMAGPIDARESPTEVNRFAEASHRMVPAQCHHPGSLAVSGGDATSIPVSSSSAASWA